MSLYIPEPYTVISSSSDQYHYYYQYSPCLNRRPQGEFLKHG
ncbi:hypothetical protein [Acinetobacter baumannii]|nr:hypothetical protein [Acinetobacter baumannii]